MTPPIVPRHKQDFERANALSSLPDRDIEPVIAELLEWTLDSNWPIAATIADALFRRPVALRAIAGVLDGPDGTGKWHLISLIIQCMPRPIAGQLRSTLQSLAAAPTSGDRHELVDEIAREALAWLAAPAGGD